MKDVLLFAGGYDINQDTAAGVDSMGRAIYRVDAESGDLLWSAGMNGHTLSLSDMKYSIPSNIRAIDVNRDGLVDQFYVGDMGGQVWRFDVRNGSSTGNLIEGGVIATLAGGNVNEQRRFYHAPDVTTLIQQGKRKLAIGIGSGYHAHPLNKVIQDRFYLLRYKIDSIYCA